MNEHVVKEQVIALFDTPAKASTAVEALGSSGVSSERISVLVGDEFREEYFGPANTTHVVEGAATGGAVGGGLGMLLSGLVVAAPAAVPIAGLFIAGPIVAVLAGAGAGAATGGLVGALIGFGVSVDQAKQYAEAITESGGILLAVSVDNDDRANITKLLEGAGGAAVFGAM